MSLAATATRRRLLFGAACIIALVAGYIYWTRGRLEISQQIKSPDGRFLVVVYRRPMWPSTMPGQGSDAPGIVRLYDSAGNMLQEAPIDMVQHINDLEWSPGHVRVPLIFDWTLPE